MCYAGDVLLKDKILFLGPAPHINVKPEAEHGLPPRFARKFPVGEERDRESKCGMEPRSLPLVHNGVS